MSFAMTNEALLAGRKSVTRRLGWLSAKPGDQVVAVDRLPRNARGNWRRLGVVTFTAVDREPLLRGLVERGPMREIRREGLEPMKLDEFLARFAKATGCGPGHMVTRIAFTFRRTA
jgi:hypothetical protein